MLNCWDCCIDEGVPVESRYREYWCRGCVIYQEKMKENKMDNSDYEIWLRSSDYIGDVRAEDWEDLQRLLNGGYYISKTVKVSFKVTSYQIEKGGKDDEKGSN